jgi:hypothetical protein
VVTADRGPGASAGRRSLAAGRRIAARSAGATVSG